MADETANPTLQIAPQRSSVRAEHVVFVAALMAFAIFVVAAYQRSWPTAVLALLTALIGAAGAIGTRRKINAADAFRERTAIPLETTEPEVQCENLNIEVRELARLLEAPAEQIADLQTAFIVAEDLALRQIQQEENVSIHRHTGIGGVPFDAVFFRGRDLVCGEVAFVVTPDIRQERLDAMMRKIALVKHFAKQRSQSIRVVLMMIVITQLAEEEVKILTDSLRTKRFHSTPVDVEIRMLDFAKLQASFITEEN